MNGQSISNFIQSIHYNIEKPLNKTVKGSIQNNFVAKVSAFVSSEKIVKITCIESLVNQNPGINFALIYFCLYIIGNKNSIMTI